MTAHRVVLSREKGWTLPPNTVVVARPSRWGNVAVIGQPCEVQVSFTGRGPLVGAYDQRDLRSWDTVIRTTMTREDAVLVYRADLEATLAYPDDDPRQIREALEALRGKNLACWCRLDEMCHADVLLDLANR